MRLLLFLILLAVQRNVNAQPVTTLLKRSVPVTCTYSGKFPDPFSFTSNQAALASIQKPVAGLYSERRFMLPGMNFFMLSVICPYASGGLGMKMQHAGTNYYNESTIGLAIGRKISNLLSLGIQFNYYGARMAGIGVTSAANFEAGLIFQLTEDIQSGFHLKNPVKIKGLGMPLPTVFTVAIGYDCSEKIHFSSTIEKQEHLPSNLMVAMHYALAPVIALGFGISTSEDNFFFSTALQWAKGTVQLNTAYHQYLGFTPSCTMIFPIEKKKKE